MFNFITLDIEFNRILSLKVYIKNLSVYTEYWLRTFHFCLGWFKIDLVVVIFWYILFLKSTSIK